MTSQTHLRSIAPPAESGGADGGGAKDSKPRAPQAQRAALPLPTDRIVTDLQFRMIQTTARLSGGPKAMITAEDIAKGTGDTAASSVVLAFRFYVSIGLIEKDSEGRYAATDALAEYSRRLVTHDAEFAAKALHGHFQRAWFWATLAPRLADSPMKVGDAKILLMREAEAGETHVNKVNHLIALLRKIGLIEVKGDEITLIESTGAEVRVNPDDAPPAHEDKTKDAASGGSRSEVQESSDRREGDPPATVLAVSFDVRVTADDLARLTPDQIRALFEAVGTVMALGGGKG